MSAGSIAATATFAETYREPRRGNGEALSTEEIVFDTPDGELRMILVWAQGLGLVDFAIIPHVDNADHQDMAIAEQWAAKTPAPPHGNRLEFLSSCKSAVTKSLLGRPVSVLTVTKANAAAQQPGQRR